MNEKAVEMADIVISEIGFLLNSNLTKAAKARSIANSITTNLDIRTYTDCGQIDQRTINIEYTLTRLFEFYIVP